MYSFYFEFGSIHLAEESYFLRFFYFLKYFPIVYLFEFMFFEFRLVSKYCFIFNINKINFIMFLL